MPSVVRLEEFRRQDASSLTDEEARLRELMFQVAKILPRKPADALIVAQGAYVVVKSFFEAGAL